MPTSNNPPAPLLEEARARRSMESSALGRAVARVNLPPLPAPSLKGLTVKKLELAPVTQTDVMRAFEEAILVRVPREPKAPGARVELGDWVTLDVVAHADGILMPELTCEGTLTELTVDLWIPGLGSKLVGVSVGTTVEVELNVPSDYPVEAFRGLPATLRITVQDAAKVCLPPGDVDSPEFLKAVGLPEDPDAALQFAAAQVVRERQLMARRQRTDEVIEQLLKRAPYNVPEAAVDAVIGASWVERQGKLLLKGNATSEEREFAAGAWLANEQLREEIRRRIHGWLVVSAVAREHKLGEIRRAELEELLRAFAGSMGLPADEVVQAFNANPQYQREVLEQVTWLRTLEFLLDQAKETEG